MENYKFGFDAIKTESGVLKYYDFEKRVVNLINDNRFSMILKGRQQHISTILAAYSAWSILNGKNIAYYTIKRDLCKHFINRVRLMLVNYGAEFDVDNKIQFSLVDGGSIVGMSNPTNFCSQAVDEIIYDEAAFIDRFEEAFSIGSTILSTGGKLIVASTPNGPEKFFNLWQGSVLDENDFKRIKITYKDNPRYDEEWAERMKKMLNMNEREINQELYAEFVMPIPKITKPKNKMIQFRLNDDLFNKLSMKLIEDDVNISKYLRGLIIKDVNE